MQSAARSLMLRLNDWSVRRPLLAAGLAGGVKGMGADAGVQWLEGKEYNQRRNLFFLLFGSAYVGCVQYLLFIKAFPLVRIPFLRQTRWTETFKSVSLDACAHLPFMYLPVFYISREWMVPVGATLAEARNRGMSIWGKNVMDDVKMNLAIFGPTQTFNFYANPPHLRVPFQCAMGVIWVVCLSYFRGDDRV